MNILRNKTEFTDEDVRSYINMARIIGETIRLLFHNRSVDLDVREPEFRVFIGVYEYRNVLRQRVTDNINGLRQILAIPVIVDFEARIYESSGRKNCFFSIFIYSILEDDKRALQRYAHAHFQKTFLEQLQATQPIRER